MLRLMQLTAKTQEFFCLMPQRQEREKKPENVNRGNIYRLKTIAGGIYFIEM